MCVGNTYMVSVTTEITNRGKMKFADRNTET